MYEEGQGEMEKRAFKRVPEKVRIDFSYDNEMYEGTVRNFSKSGMYIVSEDCPPSESNIGVVLILGDEVFKSYGKVKRRVYGNELSGGMGVELLDPSSSYAEFVSTVIDYNYQMGSYH